MTRIQISGGDPTAEEVAALATTLTALAAAAPAEAPASRGPAWSRAARLEQAGHGPLVSATDPRLVHRPSGALPPGVTAAGA